MIGSMFAGVISPFGAAGGGGGSLPITFDAGTNDLTTTADILNFPIPLTDNLIQFGRDELGNAIINSTGTDNPASILMSANSLIQLSSLDDITFSAVGDFTITGDFAEFNFQNNVNILSNNTLGINATGTFTVSTPEIYIETSGGTIGIGSTNFNINPSTFDVNIGSGNTVFASANFNLSDSDFLVDVNNINLLSDNDINFDASQSFNIDANNVAITVNNTIELTATNITGGLSVNGNAGITENIVAGVILVVENGIITGTL